VEKPEGKRQLVRPKCRWDDINMECGEIEWKKRWTRFTLPRIRTSGESLVNVTANCQNPYHAGNSLTS
jgi:hypothetical protein